MRRPRLGERLVHCDEPASREEYAALLASADVAVSTAENEFFGLAMIEACYAGCTPLVPDRLAYPELYPREYRYAGRTSWWRCCARTSCTGPRPATRAGSPSGSRSIGWCLSTRCVFAEVAGTLR